MGLFLHEITAISTPRRPPVSQLAVWALVVSATGFLNVIGFPVGIALGVIALMRIRFALDSDTPIRGRGLAIAAIWVSVIAIAVGVLAILALLVVAYAQLPSPPVHHFF